MPIVSMQYMVRWAFYSNQPHSSLNQSISEVTSVSQRVRCTAWGAH
jgi:hypothetical protein